MSESIVIGANQEPLKGPGSLTHKGGDPILIAPLENGLPGTEKTLIFEGEEKVIDGEDVFEPHDQDAYEIEDTVLVRARGQANASFARRDTDTETKDDE